jgi:hypothetical protein
VKYIASRKRVNRTYKIPYKNIAKDFETLQKQKKTVDNMVILEKLDQNYTEMKKLTKRGGKKTRRKRSYRQRPFGAK